jgi:hypothetical protein
LVKIVEPKTHAPNVWVRPVVVGVLQPNDVWLVIRTDLLVMVNLVLFHGSLDLAPHAAVSVIAEAAKFTVLIATGAELLTTELVLAFVMALNWVVQ